MAVFKKRALAEFTDVIEQEQDEQKPVEKKLRLVSSDEYEKTEKLLESVLQCSETKDALDKLKELLDSSLHKDGALLSRIIDCASKHQSLKDLLITLISQLQVDDKELYFTELETFAKNEASKRAVHRILTVLFEYTLSGEATTEHKNRLISFATEILNDRTHLLRSLGLTILSNLLTESSANEALFKEMSARCEDQDPRVRTAAFRAMHLLLQRRLFLDWQLYSLGSAALRDDYEEVRLAALELLFLLGKVFPERQVTVVQNDSEEMRLVDHIFGRVCDLMNDISWQVRERASELLGAFEGVDEAFLLQTLDKKIMSNLRAKSSLHERSRQLIATGEWSSGRRWGDDAPKDLVDEEGLTFIQAGACGAFVHALEDEHQEVRLAAVRSMNELAKKCARLAAPAVDFLVDVLNDEIVDLRLAALSSLRGIELREDQIEPVLACLQDAFPEVRQSVRDTLTLCRLSGKGGLLSCVHALLDNLRRYPVDKEYILRCLTTLGSKDPALVAPLVPELLSAHPFLDTPEPELDDPAYEGVLLMARSAARCLPSLLPLFPPHSIRHLDALRDRTSTTPPTPLTRAQELIDALQRKAEQACHPWRQEVLRLVVRDLHQLARVEKQLEAGATAVARCYECLASLLDRNVTVGRLQQVRRSMLELTTVFSGLSEEQLGAVRLLALIAHVWLAGEGPLHGLKNGFQQALKGALACQPWTASLLPELQKLIAMEKPSAAVITNALRRCLESFPIKSFRLTQPLEQVRVRLHETHEGNQERPLRFAAGLATVVPLTASFDQLGKSKDAVRVRVTYPDKRTHLVRPRDTEWSKTPDGATQMQTQVLLSHALWTESSVVELCVLLVTKDSLFGDEVQIQLAEPRKVYIQPQAPQKIH